MSYSAQTFTAGEQPTTSKWNIIWSNDASFNDGTGIANMAVNTTSISNPYKFRAYCTTSPTPGSNGLIRFDGETFDTNGNYDNTTNYRYTVPVNGFYWYHSHVNWSAAGSVALGLIIQKNGVTIAQTVWVNTYGSTFQEHTEVTCLIQCSAGDTIRVIEGAGFAGALSGGSNLAYFEGFLISQT